MCQDAIIIGAGVIGNSIATELSRSGWPLPYSLTVLSVVLPLAPTGAEEPKAQQLRRTLNVDKLKGAGQGSTGAPPSAVVHVRCCCFESIALAAWGCADSQSISKRCDAAALGFLSTPLARLLFRHLPHNASISAQLRR